VDRPGGKSGDICEELAVLPTYRSGCATQTGCVRRHNEDSYFVDDNLGLWLVADGMGGHDAGEVASSVIVETVPDAVRLGVSLGEALQAANGAVYQCARHGSGRHGMGATVVALRLRGYDYEIAWVGDSRAYRWDGASLELLTRDHSFVQELVDAGGLTPEQARSHPQRNLITRAVGLEPVGVQVEIVHGRLLEHQKVLLCSDGLNGELTDKEIEAVVAGASSNQRAVEALIQAALDRGGRDNVTVIMVTLSE
jgi:protein phosphatase